MHKEVGVFGVDLPGRDRSTARSPVDDVGRASRHQAVAIIGIRSARLDELGREGVAFFDESHGYFFLVRRAAREGDALAGVLGVAPEAVTSL